MTRWKRCWDAPTRLSTVRNGPAATGSRPAEALIRHRRVAGRRCTARRHHDPISLGVCSRHSCPMWRSECAESVDLASWSFTVAGPHSRAGHTRRPGVRGYLAGMVISGLGFGMYMAVDLALVVDVLPDPTQAAKDLGALNIAGALPF